MRGKYTEGRLEVAQAVDEPVGKHPDLDTSYLHCLVDCAGCSE